MKQGREIKTIGSICDIKTGKLDANAASENGAYPFFTCSQAPLRIDNYAYDCECVLVAGNGELNAKYYNGKFNAYQRTYIITTKSEYKNISVKYLYKFFSKYIEQLRQLSIGGVIKYIKLGNLTDAKLPVPPREEQERIVAELDCLSGVIERKREQLQQLDALAQSIFYQMFGDPITNEKGWEVKKWNDMLTIINGKNQKAVENPNGEFPIYGSGGIMGYADKYLCPKDTIVIGRKGNINKPIFVKEPFWNVDTAFGLIADNKSITPYYLFFFCRIFDFEQLNKAVTIPSLTKSDLLQLGTPCPPLTLQQVFADKIDAIEKQKQLIKDSIAETEELFNSRMDYYFN